ncbi:isoamyl acetate-hydrolyzing esterase [Coelomomyces lativittatus]|nr:isoamyl acetate-hydrolyzing esterase [Coelomomyces lativittatus]
MIKTIAILGDSLTKHGFDVHQQGWLAQLADLFAGQIDFLNRGLSGYTVPMYLQHLPSILETLPSSLDLCILFLGTNDTSLPPSLQHVPFSSFSNSLLQLVDELKKHFPVLVVTPTRSFCPSHSDEVHAQYAAWIRQNVPCDILDLYHEEIDASWFTDGLHFGPSMNTFTFKKMLQYIQSNITVGPLGPSYKDVLGTPS